MPIKVMFQAETTLNGRIFADDIFKVIVLNESFFYFDSIFTEVNGSVGNSLACVQVIHWGQTGDKPLSVQVMTEFTDASYIYTYIHYLAAVIELIMG